jgi:nicotinate phosphoribosyltransferase
MMNCIDLYQLTMAQVYFLKGRHQQPSVFDYFFRKNPFEGGYTLFSGLEEFLSLLETLSVSEADLDYLHNQGFDSSFLNYLAKFRFSGSIYSVREGDLVFPYAPIMRVEGDLIETQLIETLLLNQLNFQSLIATKASRMREAAGNRTLVELGLRRAQGQGGYAASRAAMIGGFDASSNVSAARDFGLPLSGTMAHAFIQSYSEEIQAFREFSSVWTEKTVFLVDTYNTLDSGLPKALTVAKEMEAKGQRLQAIRLDSGDLAYLSKQARTRLDKAGFTDVKIAVSNQLDEHLIKSLIEQGAPIDIFGVGTSLVTGYPDGALDGVYKLALLNEEPRIKRSDISAKTTLPHRKQVYRLFHENGGFWGADFIALENEQDVDRIYHPFDPLKSLEIKGIPSEPLLVEVMVDGQRRFKPLPVHELREYSQYRLALLPKEFKRFLNPHHYKVSLSGKLKAERDRLLMAMARIHVD